MMARQLVDMPAYAVLGLWIVLQVFSQITVAGGQTGGVAYMAHIGGFVAGVALIYLFGGRRAPLPPPNIGPVHVEFVRARGLQLQTCILQRELPMSEVLVRFTTHIAGYDKEFLFAPGVHRAC